ncbi:MAG TPA: hypothetical protein PLV13_08100 [Ilumatobacteraceae bacterium]|nr:hypothetical protein [Ilumatobacteraceae bacterium]
MGLHKNMKDLKATVAAAPGMVDQAQQMAASAQAMQAAQMQQAMAYQQAAAQPLPAEALTPINGVDLPTYAWVGKRVAAHNYDQSFCHQYAAQKGISAGDWDAGAAGWTTRMQQYPALGQEFRRHYDVA